MFTIFIGGALLEFASMRFLNKNFHQLFYPHLYQTHFYEDSLNCKKEKLDEFKKQVIKGRQKMSQETVVFAGLARDLEKELPQTIERIKITAELFKDYRVVVFENDSKDGTRDLLKDWARQDNKVILVECAGNTECKFGEKSMYEIGPFSMNRMQKMANFRNYYLKLIKKRFSHFDYLLVLDMDLDGPWSNDGIAQTIAHGDWDGIFAYGLHSLPGTFATYLTLYDGLAYVGNNSSYQDAATPIVNYLKMNFLDLRGVQRCDDFIPVKSSFSGMAIYKMKSIKNAWYNASRLCEHVGFHEQMAKGGHGKFYINPSLTLFSGHQGPPNALKLFFL